MNCNQAELEIAARSLEAAAVWSEELTSHLEACEVCRRLLTEERQIDDAIRQWKHAAIPGRDDPSRVDHILDAWRASTVPASVLIHEHRRKSLDRRWFVSGVAGLAAIAAAILVTAWPMISSPLRRNPELKDVVDARLTLPPQVASHDDVRPARASVHPVSDSVASLWQEFQTGPERATTATVQQWEQLPGLVMPSLDAVASQPAVSTMTPEASTSEASPLLANPWRQLGQPLGEGVAEAFGFLGRALPDVQVPAT